MEQAIDEWRWRQADVHSAAPRQPATDAVEDSSVSAEPTSAPITEYVRIALERNPGVAAAAAEARAALARIPQVTSLPDPQVLAVARGEPIQTAAGDVLFTLGISQTYPLLEKLERAGDAAAADALTAISRLNERRVAVVADVERAFWRVYLLDRSIELAEENTRVLSDLERVVNTQYKVAQTAQQDLLRLQIALSDLRDQIYRLQLRRSAAAAELNRLMHRSGDSDIPLTREREAAAVAGEVDELIDLANEHNPSLAALRARLERDRQRVALADLGYWPDLTLGFEWNYLEGRGAWIPPVNPNTGQRPPINRKSEAGDDNWAIRVQMNVPIWVDRVEAAKRERRQELKASQSALASEQDRIAFRIFDAWSRVQSERHTLSILQEELIPQARQTYQVTLTSYQAGEADFSTLIDDWRRWLDFELMLHRETADLGISVADLQQQVGLRVGAALANGDSTDGRGS